MCTREITLSRTEFLNNFNQRNIQTLSSINVLDPGDTARSCSLLQSINSMRDTRQDTNQLDHNEIAETFLFKIFQNTDWYHILL